MCCPWEDNQLIYFRKITRSFLYNYSPPRNSHLPEPRPVLSDLADDPLVGEFLAGAGEGMWWREFAGDVLVEVGILEGRKERLVGDGDAGAGP